MDANTEEDIGKWFKVISVRMLVAQEGTDSHKSHSASTVVHDRRLCADFYCQVKINQKSFTSIGSIPKHYHSIIDQYIMMENPIA